MKNVLLLLILTVCVTSCVTINKMTNEAFNHAFVGQSETIIYSRLGFPTRTLPASSGGKIMIYEFYSKGMFLTPYKSKVTYSAEKDILGNREGLTFHSGINTATNDPEYTIYEKDVSCLKLFLDKQGNCFQFEQNLTREQLEAFYEQFKRYIPKD